MTTLRDELLAEVGPKTHIADLCGRASDELLIKQMKIDQQERQIVTLNLLCEERLDELDALRAQLADARNVKALEWFHEEARKHWPQSWTADTSVGVYTIEHNPDEDPDFRYSLLLGEDGEHFSQLDEAMDRAQELFQGCILGGLSALEGE